MDKNSLVGIVMGSDSDFPVMKNAVDVLKEFGIPFEVKVLSAHRSPDRVKDFSANAASRGMKVIIAAAGGAAHLAGVIAAYTPLPIIGVPIKGKAFEGMDSLLSMVQMPPGVPVATVAVDGAKNAALLAVQILGTADEKIFSALVAFKKKMEEETLRKNDKIVLD